MQKISKMLVKDVMRTVKSIHPSMPIKKLISTFEKQDIDALAVIDKKGKFLGDVHERDLLKLIVSKDDISWDEVAGPFGRMVDMGFFAETAKDLMHRHDISVKPEDKVELVIKLMFKNGIDVVAVVEKDKVVGMVTEIDILEQIYKVNRRKR
jgi:CBS domain-containing protein